MKKLLVVLFSLATTAGFSQIRNGNTIIEKTRIGVYGGLSVANQVLTDPYYGDAYADDAKAGFVAGVSVSAPISYGWFVQPEISYSNMGTHTYIDDETGYANLNLNYLNVPILFRYSQPFTGFGVLFGPQYSYLLNAKSSATGSLKNDVIGKGDITDGFKRSDLSGLVGLEYYFPNDGRGGAQFGLSARYQFGFLNVNNGNASYDDGGPDPKIHNNGFFITAGVRF